MKKGSVAKASMSKPTEGKKDNTNVKGGKVEFGYAPAGRKGKKA